MSSQFWERLRAARKYSGLRQEDIADACGISRSAYAFWETHKDESRTHPTVEQVQTFATLTKTPLEWLMRDESELSDVGAFASVQSRHGTQTPTATGSKPRGVENFWRAVEFKATERRPDLGKSFGRGVAAGPLEFFIDFATPKSLVLFEGKPWVHTPQSWVATLLSAEKMSGPAGRKKIVLVWAPDGDPSSQELGAQLAPAIGIDVKVVHNVEDAAAVLEVA